MYPPAGWCRLSFMRPVSEEGSVAEFLLFVHLPIASRNKWYRIWVDERESGVDGGSQVRRGFENGTGFF